MNDITQIFNFARIKMYADDLTIHARINNNNDRIEVVYKPRLWIQWIQSLGAIWIQ